MKASTFVAGIGLAALAGAGAFFYLNKSEAPAPQPVADNAAASEAADQQVANIPAQESVVTLPSGVQYEVLEAGYGDVPAATDTVLVRYVASLPDGRIFDTTEDDQEPAVVTLDEIAVPGLKEALLLMHEGDHWRVVVPRSEGFGRFGKSQLRRHDLIYDIRLVAIDPPV